MGIVHSCLDIPRSQQHPERWHGATALALPAESEGPDWKRRRQEQRQQAEALTQQQRQQAEALARQQEAQKQQAEVQAWKLQEEERCCNTQEYHRRKYLETFTQESIRTKRCLHGYPQQVCERCFDICAVCEEPIRGFPCVDNRAHVHFGCCSDQARTEACEAYDDELQQELEAAQFIVKELPSLELPPLKVASVNAAESCEGTSEAAQAGDVAEDSKELTTERHPSDLSLPAWVSSCQNFSYHFDLRVVRAYELSNSSLKAQFEATKTKMGTVNVKRLFHGTTIEAAEAIHNKGFRLPWHAGMFGKGIYFADNPQKSWQYCRGSRHMLVVDVVLGATKELREADSTLSRRSGFDSVKGLAIPEGCLRSAEFIVYNEAQVLPLFLLELRED